MKDISVTNITYKEEKENTIYTVELSDNNKYTFETYFITHAGTGIIPEFLVDGLEAIVMIDTIAWGFMDGDIKEYNWYQSNSNKKIRPLTQSEVVAYQRIESIFKLAVPKTIFSKNKPSKIYEIIHMFGENGESEKKKYTKLDYARSRAKDIKDRFFPNDEMHIYELIWSDKEQEYIHKYDENGGLLTPLEVI